jgi:hypothetical protein
MSGRLEGKVALITGAARMRSASDESVYVTGSELVIDGGVTG